MRRGCRSTWRRSSERERRPNPMVNPGAIATTSRVPGRTPTRDGRSCSRASRARRADPRPSTRRCTARRRRRTSESGTRPVARRGTPGSDPATRSTSTPDKLALGSPRSTRGDGATLADGGVNPVTHEQVVAAETCRHALAVMTTAGLYETSGDWSTTSGCRARAGSAAGRDRRPRKGRSRGRSRLCSTRRETASTDSLRHDPVEGARARPVRVGAGGRPAAWENPAV